MHSISLKRTKVAWFLGLGISISSLFVLAWVNTLSFVELKDLVDSLTPDKNLESFTEAIYADLKISFLVGMLLAFGSLVYLSLFRQRAQNQLSAIIDLADRKKNQWKREAVSLWEAVIHIETDRRVLVLILLIAALAALNRYVYLWRPMSHDEAYTYIAFASRGLRIAITDYHLPNNHIFLTILVSLAARMFGDSPAVIRLPVFLAGILIVPAIYVLARHLYGKGVGLVSAAILASAPVLIDYSTNARGYMLLALFTVMLLAIGAYLVRSKNEIAWALFVVLASLGIYTHPTMIYPIATVFTWMFLRAIFHQANPAYGRKIFLYFVIALVSIVLLSAVFYAPVVLYSGLDSLIGNNFIASLSWSDFLESIPVRVRNTWEEWNRDLPKFFSLIGLLGLGMSILISVKSSRQRLLLMISSIFAIGIILLIQRVAPWPRVWLFLFPLVVMWITAGFLGFLHLVVRKLASGEQLLRVISGVCIVLPLLVSGIRSFNYFDSKFTSPGGIEKAAIYLSGTLNPGDVVVVTSPDSVILDYYLKRYGIDPAYVVLSEHHQFREAFVLVNTRYGQNLEYVLKERSFSEYVNPSAAELVFSANWIEIYAIPGNN
jgi:4-amino-4-deoxy-L-arabinose transferase-like glycosyltransferase